MLTKRQNLLETIQGGHPDRYVNCHEAFAFIIDPILTHIGGFAYTMKPGETVMNQWGVTVTFPKGCAGPLPIHSNGLAALKDITKWKETVRAPRVVYPPEVWETAKAQADTVDRREQFVAAFMAPGIFEKINYLMGMEPAMVAFYEEPEAMHELFDFMADWELAYAKELMKYIKPDLVFHHDDFGTQYSSFFSPQMFQEFFVPVYKKVYGYFKEQGCLIVHHSDSYVANLIPSMIEMGIDIHQGTIHTNNLPELVKTYGGQISFMGGIDNSIVDREDWTHESIAAQVKKICDEIPPKYFLPCTSMGGPDCSYPGVYEAVCEEIEKYNKKRFCIA